VGGSTIYIYIHALVLLIHNFNI